MNITTKWRRGLPLFLIISLTLSMLSILAAFPAIVQAVGFNPECLVDLDPLQAERGKTFTASVVCENIRRENPLFGYQGQLRYDPNIVQVKLPFDPLQDTICDPDLVGACDVAKLQYEESKPPLPKVGVVNWEVFLTGYPVGFFGDALLLKINFVVVVDKGTSPFALGGECTSGSEIDQMCLLDATLSVLPHTETDNTFRVGRAFVRVDPPMVLKPVGTKFTVHVTVDNVEGLFAYAGMLKYDPRVIQVQPNGLSLEKTICEAQGACDVAQLQFNDLTGEITWEIFLVGYPRGFSTDAVGPGKAARLIQIHFVVVDDTGRSLLEFKESPKTGAGPCDEFVIAPDEICLLDEDLDEIPHSEDNGAFGVFQTVCRIEPDPASESFQEPFSTDLICDDVQGLFKFGGVVMVDPTVLLITAATEDAPGLVCHAAACEPEEATRFNDLTGEVFFEITLIGYPRGFTGDARLVRITYKVINDRGTTAIQIKSPTGEDCNTKGDTDQMCLLDDTLSLPGIPHDEDPGTFEVGPGDVRVEGSSGVIIRPVGDTFDANATVTTTRGIFGHGGTLKYQTEILTAKAASVTGPGTTCPLVGACEVIDLTINDPAGEVTWEVTIIGEPRGFTGTAALITVTFNVEAKGTTLLELKSPPGEDCTTGSEHDQVCLLDELLSPAPHTEADGLFSVNLPQNPTAVLLPEDPQKISLGEKLFFGGMNSFDNNSPPEPITSYDFSVNGVLAQSGGSVFFSLTPTAEGTYVVSLVVCNESRFCSTNSEFTVVDVNPTPKRPPIVDFVWDADQNGIFENGPIFVGQSVTFKSISTDPQNQALISWAWDFDEFPPATAQGEMVKHVFTAARLHTVKLTVCNDSKVCETEPKDITISSGPVTADLVQAPATYVTEVTTLTVEISAGVPPYSCSIDFGDGFSMDIPLCADGQAVTHTYAATGTYTATLTVTDASMGTATDMETISVQPEPRFIHQKLSWKHHLTVTTQTFNVNRIFNPSKFTVNIIVVLTITKPDGTIDPREFKSGVLLPPGESLIMQFNYQATLLGKYCFTATFMYQVDGNGDGIIDVTGTGPNRKSGCFNRV